MSGLFQDDPPPADDAPPPAGPGLFGDSAPAEPTAAYRVLARKFRPTRFEDLIGEVTAVIPHRAIGQSINLVVFVKRTPQGRRVEEVIRVKGRDANGYILEGLSAA